MCPGLNSNRKVCYPSAVIYWHVLSPAVIVDLAFGSIGGKLECFSEECSLTFEYTKACFMPQFTFVAISIIQKENVCAELV